jgi:hypothetical protein
MNAKVRIMLMATCLLLMSMNIHAADYKNWLSLLPETMGDLARKGKPDGINMEMNGQSWSSLQQNYSDKAGKTASFTLVSGAVAPQAQAFQMMSHMQMETEDQIVKTLHVAGYKAVYQLQKEDKNGSLMISLNQQTFVVIEAEPITSEKELVALAKDVPLGKISTKVK